MTPVPIARNPWTRNRVEQLDETIVCPSFPNAPDPITQPPPFRALYGGQSYIPAPPRSLEFAEVGPTLHTLIHRSSTRRPRRRIQPHFPALEGFCSICDRRYKLMADGNVRWHRASGDPSAPACDGARQPPA